MNDSEKTRKFYPLFDGDELIDWVEHSDLNLLGERPFLTIDGSYMDIRLFVCPKGRPMFEESRYDDTQNVILRATNFKRAVEFFSTFDLPIPRELKDAWERERQNRKGGVTSDHDVEKLSSATSPTNCCPFTLNYHTREVTIAGHDVPYQVAPEQFTVVQAMVNCWPKRLTKDQIDRIGGLGDALGVFKRLIKKSPWKVFLSAAGNKGNGYGWRPIAESITKKPSEPDHFCP